MRTFITKSFENIKNALENIQFEKVLSIPDIIKIRLSEDIESKIWTTNLVSSSVEFFGYSKFGNPIIIISHNYNYFSNRKDLLNNEDGIIKKDIFEKIYNGEFGEVIVVNVDKKMINSIKNLENNSMFSIKDALDNPLLVGRLGGIELAKEYLYRQYDESKRIHKNHSRLIPIISSIQDFYKDSILKKEDNFARSNLLKLSGVYNNIYNYELSSLVCEIGLLDFKLDINVHLCQKE